MESATKNYNNTEYKMSLRWGRFMVFNATFNNISVIIVEETGVLEKKHEFLQVTDKLYHIMLF